MASIFSTACEHKNGLIESMMLESGRFQDVLENADKHRLQIIYTQIDRDEDNNASFTTHKYRVSNDEYFYPASSIKLPMAALALEKVNDLQIDGFTPFSEMHIDSAFSGQSPALEDSTSENGKASIAHYIKKIFLVSDNDAFNRLYEFLGQQRANERLINKGYEHIRITHRLSLPLSLEENQHTNPMKFYDQDLLVYQQDAAYNEQQIKSDTPIFIGKGYMSDEKLITKPMDFSFKNAIGLESLHQVLLSIIFPDNFAPSERFNLTEDDYKLLLEYMSKYPGESDYPNYGSKYPDGYCKLLMFGGTQEVIDPNFRIFNKIGEAYGFLIDMAYVVDFEKKIEFVLGAVIYVNENEILNDGDYEYAEIGYPFMRDLGQLIYDHELNRQVRYKPDLSKFNLAKWED